MAASAGDSSVTPESAAESLCAEFQSAWSMLANLIGQSAQAASSLQGQPKPAKALVDVRERYEEATRALLVEPVEQTSRLRPIGRSLEAMQRYDQGIAPRASRLRAGIDARFQRLLAQAAVALCEPWRIWRRGNYDDEWTAWTRRCAGYSKTSSVLLAQYANWARRAGSDAESDAKTVERPYETWWRQERAISALFGMETGLRDLGVAWLTAAQDFVENVRREREAMLWVGKQTLDWIRSGAEPNTLSPIEKLDLVSPDEHMRVWSHSIETEAAKRLPEHIELVVPGRFPKQRAVAAREAFLAAFATCAQPRTRQVVEHYFGRTAEVAREVSRAREIVDYWREAHPADSSGEQALFAEARRNATAILEEQTKTPDGIEELEADLTAAFWAWNEDGSTSIEAAQFGWAELLQPARAHRIAGHAAGVGRQRARVEARRAGHWAAGKWDRVQEVVGGRVPTQSALQPVVRRTTLRDTLSLPAAKSNLPGLYRLLFRIAPVDDRRFLVGRGREMGGLAQALADWDAGRFAACLVVGDRGSGKTSLLNCAEKEAFRDRSLIRGQFRDRALCQEQIDGFLRELLKLEQDADLDAAFAAQRRILVIEECERIYLRKVGGFAGTHYMIHLIHRTAPTTLWVIVMNDKAARVLNAGAELRRVFSHRINAMSVSREDLENAILERHRLSGMRLEFAPPPAGDPRVGRAKKWLGLQDSPQKLFFDSLYQQSEGIFRSAFDLWLSSIERVEGETVHIRQPLDPAFSQFREELAQEDHFTLLAIQEHGSLTREELAEVLCEAHDVSRSRLDRLFALGLIEPDPEHPGMRVRPEAQRFSNDLLRRANLI